LFLFSLNFKHKRNKKLQNQQKELAKRQACDANEKVLVIGNRLANIGIYKKSDYNELSSQTELFLNNNLSNGNYYSRQAL
jgi:hypothetical protein